MTVDWVFKHDKNNVYLFFFPFTDETLYYNVIAGVIAGAVSSTICNPTDVLKVIFRERRIMTKASIAFSSFT